MHNFSTNYEKILEVLDSFPIPSSFLKQVRKPKFSDKELICVNLTAEYMGIDSEHQLFRILPKAISLKIERSVYNRRKRGLFPFIEKIREDLSTAFNPHEQFYIVDSMPLEVCKLSRSSRSKICKEQAYSSPNKGYCASQGSSYYGYKLHAVCSVKGVFKSIDISPASVHDIHYLKDIKSQLKNCTLLGDKGYLSSKWQLDLFNSCNIKLNTPMRNNQKQHRAQPYIFRKSSKQIETLFSQLCDQLCDTKELCKVL